MYRGSDSRLHYLSPWEFTKWWEREELRHPDWYKSKQQAPRTQWTEAGLAYKAELAADEEKVLPSPKPGTHYVVMEPRRGAAYVVFPDVPETSIIRHRWVLVRRVRPAVPTPKRTPMLKKNMPGEERALLLSLYMSPLMKVAGSTVRQAGL